MYKKLEASEVKREATGRWVSILASLAPALQPALERPGKHTWCPDPSHKQKNGDAFRVYKDVHLTGGGICNTCGGFSDGFALLMWVNGWDFVETLKAVARELGMDVDGGNPAPVRKLPPAVLLPPEPDPEEVAERNEKLRAFLTRIWQEAYPLDAKEAEPARLYLARRGLSTQNLPPVLRLHPSMKYYENRKHKSTWPCIVAMVQDANGRPITLHRIYVTHDGRKAPVGKVKKLMPYPSDRKIQGAAIRLGPVAAAMGVSEGFETGLAVQQATGMSVWVTITATLMRSVEIPEECEMLCIWGDKDRSEAGKVATRHLVQRMWEEGRMAAGLLPSDAIPDEEKSVDWLDVLNEYGPEAIPKIQRVRQLLRQAVG